MLSLFVLLLFALLKLWVSKYVVRAPTNFLEPKVIQLPCKAFKIRMFEKQRKYFLQFIFVLNHELLTSFVKIYHSRNFLILNLKKAYA